MYYLILVCFDETMSDLSNDKVSIMKLFTREQLRAWDQVTIDNFYSSSSELMESVGSQCALVLLDKVPAGRYVFFCGTGNNGGDGLVMARLLREQQIAVQVHVVGESDKGSNDFRLNLQRALDSDVPLEFIHEMPNEELAIEMDDVVVDAIFGTGLNRPVEGWLAELIEEINSLTNPVVSIDIPSGMDADAMEEQKGAIIRADVTLTIEVPKRAMLFPENDSFVGKMVLVPLSFDPEFAEEENCNWHYIDGDEMAFILRPVQNYRHKGNRGHLQVIAGSRGMMGAAMFATYAALRSGTGKVTAYVPECGLQLMQTNVPEVICKIGTGVNACEHFESVEGSTAIVLGPGCGTGAEAMNLVDGCLKAAHVPLILDADSLNIIAREGWLKRIPARSVITPHVGEFDRLFGPHLTSFDRLQTQLNMSAELRIFIALKGAHTRITAPNGFVYINSTGNPGMATSGSGDVLSGMIGSLLAQGFDPLDASLLGVYLHGLAGDMAAEGRGMDSMMARDMIEFIGDAFLHLRHFRNNEG